MFGMGESPSRNEHFEIFYPPAKTQQVKMQVAGFAARCLRKHFLESRYSHNAVQFAWRGLSEKKNDKKKTPPPRYTPLPPPSPLADLPSLKGESGRWARREGGKRGEK